ALGGAGAAPATWRRRRRPPSFAVPGPARRRRGPGTANDGGRRLRRQVAGAAPAPPRAGRLAGVTVSHVLFVFLSDSPASAHIVGRYTRCPRRTSHAGRFGLPARVRAAPFRPRPHGRGRDRRYPASPCPVPRVP